MKKVLLTVLAVSLCIPVMSFADAHENSWWLMTESRPQPVQDAVRGGYWWWPINAASNADDSELWGNRGLVYGSWEPERAPVEAPAPAPPAAPPAQVTRSVPVFNDVLFDFDSAALRPEANEVINQVAGSLNANPGDTLTVVGHTCDIGSSEYNMGLGQRRADSVVSGLTSAGIAASRLSAVSRGETEPAVPNTSSANRKLNRRAVFEYSIND